MKRGNRLASARTSLVLVLVLSWATATGGCGSLLGIDDGMPYPADGSADSTVGSDAAPDATGADVAGDDTSTPPDTGSSGDDVSTTDSATTDSTTTDSAATDSTAMDAPGMDAPDDVTPGNDSGDACVPEGKAAACGSNECGSALDNCGNTVGCGVGGSIDCASGQKCITNMGASTCCVQATCAGRCNTTISDNCGGTLTCPSSDCPSGQVCNNAATDCCVPSGTCGGPCVDNCGQQDSNCCDAGMTMDAMPPPCTPNGSLCGASIAPCCSGICAPPPGPLFIPAGGGGGDSGLSSSGSGGGSGGSSGSSSGGMSSSSCGGPSSGSSSSGGFMMPDAGMLPPVCQP